MVNKVVYVGTLDVSRPWYNRMVKDAVFPEKGPGEYRCDHKGFLFEREGTTNCITIPMESISSVTISRFHGIALYPSGVLRISWRIGTKRFISGFLTKDAQAVKEALTARGWA